MCPFPISLNSGFTVLQSSLTKGHIYAKVQPFIPLFMTPKEDFTSY